MEFRETFTSPFTTPTTCYSCASKRIGGWACDDDDSSPWCAATKTIQFATESHILGVNVAEDRTKAWEPSSTTAEGRTFCRFLPRDSAQLTCVGYSNRDVEETIPATNAVTMTSTSTSTSEISRNNNPGSSTFHRIEALALIDPVLVEDHLLLSDPESSPSTINLHRPSSSVVIEKDDAASMVTTGASQSKTGLPHLKVVHSTSASSILSGGTGTTTTTTTNPPLSSGSVSGYHRKSQSELSKGSHTTASASDAQQSGSIAAFDLDKDKSQPQQQQQQQQHTSRLLQKSRGRLVLRHDRFVLDRQRPVRSGGNNNNDKDDAGGEDGDRPTLERRRRQESSFALLDFRPLCPCVARWERGSTPSGNNGGNGNGNVNNSGNHHAERNGTRDPVVGIWVGSADEATLRLFVPAAGDPRSLVSVALPEEHFSVDSPVMALDFCSVRWNTNGRHPAGTPSTVDSGGPEPTPTTMAAAATTTTTTHTLAVGCQDGTIQLITWSDPTGGNDSDTTINTHNPNRLFGDISSQKVIVDGPLVCLKLEYNRFASLRVVVGSLCGYVCQLTYDHRCSSGGDGGDSWNGPFMIVQDLFNSSINTEESVLAVDILENYVAIGTQLGRCLLYATHDSENYFQVWQAALPYPVHGIEMIIRTGAPETEEGTSPMKFRVAVTTRRSFHVFDATHGRIPWRQKPRKERYSPELARMRLSNILEEIRKENQESDLSARNVVRDTIHHLVTRVESIDRETKTNVENDPSAEQETAGAVVSSAIGDLIDRVMEHTSSNDSSKHRSSASDSDNCGALGEKVSSDPPHWEYSSSDEEVSLESGKNNADVEEDRRLPTDTKEQKAVDRD